MAKGIDWNFIKSEYEETNKSIRQIARDNDISEAAIRNKIKKNQWQKFSNSQEVSGMMVTNSSPVRGDAAKIMQEIINILGERYNPSFEAMITVFVANYEMWIDVRKQLKDAGGVISKTSKGTKQLSVEFIAMKEIEKTLREYASHIGLSMQEIMQLGLTKPNPSDSNLLDVGREISRRKINI